MDRFVERADRSLYSGYLISFLGSSEQFVGGIGCSFEERGGAPRDSEQQSLFCVLGV